MAYGPGTHRNWTQAFPRGDHAPAWPPNVTALLRKRLSSDPPASYSFAASEVLRLYDYRLDRAQVRHWAMANDLAHRKALRRPQAPVRRWQRSRIGELWQLDATPHRWFPPAKIQLPMLNMLDDCSRLFTGSKIYERETLLAYMDFLPTAFLTMACRWRSTWITTASSSLRCLMPLPPWGRRCDFTGYPSVMHPHHKPRGQGREGTPLLATALTGLTSPVNRSRICLMRIRTSQPSACITISSKSIASSR